MSLIYYDESVGSYRREGGVRARVCERGLVCGSFLFQFVYSYEFYFSLFMR